MIVDSEVRRSARLAALRDGFKHSSQARPVSLKKPSAKPIKKRKTQPSEPASPASSSQPDGPHEAVPPPTPIAVIQRVGGHLGIAPEKLTKEKLNAASDKTHAASSSSNDS